jgi:hypothetical protein
VRVKREPEHRSHDEHDEEDIAQTVLENVAALIANMMLRASHRRLGSQGFVRRRAANLA